MDFNYSKNLSTLAVQITETNDVKEFITDLGTVEQGTELSVFKIGDIVTFDGLGFNDEIFKVRKATDTDIILGVIATVPKWNGKYFRCDIKLHGLIFEAYSDVDISINSLVDYDLDNDVIDGYNLPLIKAGSEFQVLDKDDNIYTCYKNTVNCGTGSSGGGGSYTAGNGISIANDVISANTQSTVTNTNKIATMNDVGGTYTAGNGISIANDVINANTQSPVTNTNKITTMSDVSSYTAGNGISIDTNNKIDTLTQSTVSNNNKIATMSDVSSLNNVVQINDFRGTQIATKVPNDGLYQFYGTVTDGYNPCGIYVNSPIYNNKYYGFVERKGTDIYVYGFIAGSTESFYLKTETTNNNWGGTENQNSFNILTEMNGYSPDYFCTTRYTSVTLFQNNQQTLIDKMAVGETVAWVHFDLGNNILNLRLERKYSANTLTNLGTIDYAKTNPIFQFAAKHVTGEVCTVICHKRPCAPYDLMRVYRNKSIDNLGLGLKDGVIGNEVAAVNGQAIIPYASHGSGQDFFMDLIGGEQLDQRIDPTTSILIDIEAFKQYANALQKEPDGSFIANGWQQIATSSFDGVNGASPGFGIGTGARFSDIDGTASRFCLYVFDQAMSGNQFFVGLKPVDPNTTPIEYEAYYGAPSQYWQINNTTNRITAIGNPQNRTLTHIEGDFDDIIVMSYDYNDIGVIDPTSNTMTIENGQIEAKISAVAGNKLEVKSDGLYVSESAGADNGVSMEEFFEQEGIDINTLRSLCEEFKNL